MNPKCATTKMMMFLSKAGMQTARSRPYESDDDDRCGGTQARSLAADELLERAKGAPRFGLPVLALDEGAELGIHVVLAAGRLAKARERVRGGGRGAEEAEGAGDGRGRRHCFVWWVGGLEGGCGSGRAGV